MLGLIPAVIGKRKGYSFLGWWGAGFVLFIVALPWVLIVGKNPAKYRRCPSCQQWIDPKAVACSHCGRDVPALPAAYDPSRRASASVTAGDGLGKGMMIAVVLALAIGIGTLFFAAREVFWA